MNYISILILIGSLIIQNGKAGEVPLLWVSSARGLRLDVSLPKTVFQSGDPIPVILKYTNIGSSIKRIQRGGVTWQHQIEVWRDGVPIPVDLEREEKSRLINISYSPSDEVLPKESYGLHLDLNKIRDMTIPGRYTLKVTKYFGTTLEPVIGSKPERGVDYLDATTSFRVVPKANATQTKKLRNK